MIIGKYNKIILETQDIEFIQQNYSSMTNQELADHLGLKLTKLREFCHSMGLKRMEMEYWTKEQVQFLKDHYQQIGDTELAEIFNNKWFKKKGWHKRHIEKKRRYLNLKRTKEEKKNIRTRNINQGRFKICNIKMWQKRGVTPIGAIKVWHTNTGKKFNVIKVKGGFVHYNRWLWEQHYGAIPEGMNVVPKDGNSLNSVIENLEILTNAEHSRRNATRYNNYPKELKESIKLINKLTKTIKTCQETKLSI